MDTTTLLLAASLAAAGLSALPEWRERMGRATEHNALLREGRRRRRRRRRATRRRRP